ncbi:MAG: prolipoprotein diacylglyceryl transferase [Candidatus Levybacteria bacterium]|nr:prolipoprotein diacylglyceryl transferase [Candidatus Levybacteria bacterium]
MQPFIFILFFCFLVFLFCLHLFSKDDFVLLRKNISMERVFNLAFLTALSGLFFARFFYVLFHFHSSFLNPLVFFLFPYFPGLSLPGGVAGGVVFFFFWASYRKLPQARLFDIFSLSFLCALTVGFLINFFLAQKIVLSLRIAVPVIYLLLFIALVRIFLLVKLKDASIGILFLLVFSFLSFAVARIGAGNLLFLNGEDFILIEMFLLSLVFLVKQENLLAKGKKPKFRG